MNYTTLELQLGFYSRHVMLLSHLELSCSEPHIMVSKVANNHRECPNVFMITCSSNAVLIMNDVSSVNHSCVVQKVVKQFRVFAEFYICH